MTRLGVAAALFAVSSLPAGKAGAQETPPSVSASTSDVAMTGLQLELGLFGGAHFFARDLELGVPDAPGAVSTPSHGPQFGLRLAANWLPWISLEGEVSGIPTTDRFDDLSVFIASYKVHALLHILHGQWRPFVLLGAGAMQVVATDGSPVDNALGKGIERKDTDGEVHVGAGLKFDLNDRFLLRFDARTLFLPNFNDGEFSPNWELLLGASVKFGPVAAPPPAPPAAPVDSDGDGIFDSEDKCPKEAEDKDGFEDEDGCPDPDNDGDGIPDATDKCPTEAESQNGVDDDDGCPEIDEDNDGLVGSKDQCPKEPEDKDGFEDDNGCPDPDNDADGVLDADDKCPTTAETKNGFEDTDGCPDEIPAEVKKFTGAIKGIQFRKNSSSIRSISFKVLGEAVKVLNAHPDLRILIEGHTSSEGDAKLNSDLSLKRADAVKQYLESVGLAAGRIETQGFGSNRPVAPNATRRGRDQNRRIEFKLLTK